MPGDIQDVVSQRHAEHLERHRPSWNRIEWLAKLFRPQAVEQQARDDAGRVRLDGKLEEAFRLQCNHGFIENPLDAWIHPARQPFDPDVLDDVEDARAQG